MNASKTLKFVKYEFLGKYALYNTMMINKFDTRFGQLSELTITIKQ